MKKNFLAITCLFQIFLLLMMIISINYNIHQLDILPLVYAETFNCCEKTNDGAICQDVLPNYENCAVSIASTNCDSYSKCQIGCCIDEKEGTCTTKSPKAECENKGGVWSADENCNLLECKKGCCVLGDEVQFITEKRCDYLSLVFGFEKDFKNLETELNCLILKEEQSKGACVFETGICRFTTMNDCLKLKGNFAEGKLCSNEELNTTCEKQFSIGCVEGQDEIYWFDSCGNKENIYSSDKEASWNNGKVLLKSESCGVKDSNANSENCGNCNHFLGSTCSESSLNGIKVKDGNFVCKSLNCIDENGKERLNGESWCVYDGFIGDGKDTVGSRHWKRMCIDGKIIVDECADYRGQICVESQIENKDKNKNFSIASCVINDAIKCLNYNFNNDMKACTENEHCTIKNINIDEGFQFDFCVSDYPKGFDLKGEANFESKDICSMANQKCEVLYVKDWKGKWKCKNNCNCESSTFSEQMNDLCISIGDCGSYVNYLGDGTDNTKIQNAPSISWEDYKKYSETEKGQFAKPKNLASILKTLSSYGEIDSENPEESNLQKGVDLLGTISGATGTLISGANYLGLITLEKTIWLGTLEGSATSMTLPTTLGSVANAAGGIGIGMMVGSLVAKKFGIQGNAATTLTLAGGIVGGFAAYGAATYTTATTATTFGSISSFGGAFGAGTFAGFGPLLAAMAWAIIVVVIIAAIVKLIGWGDTKIVVVEFECLPWEAPLGGDNCGKCNEDSLKPCSEYRCESLGQACKLLNEDTENPICIAIPDDKTQPIISIRNISEGFIFSETEDFKTKIKEEEKECITEFTPVVFSLKTDEYAQCKYSFEKKDSYEAMENFPIEQNLFSENHTFAFLMPSIDSIHTYNTTGNIIEMYSNMNMYIRCQDYYGNYNSKEYVVNFCINKGPDLTAPIIVATNPKENNYFAHGITESNLDVYINEPAECKIDSNDRNYELMQTNMDCETDLLNYTIFGWKCSTKLKDLNNQENLFYIRCKDQPWLENDTIVTEDGKVKKRNENQESFLLTIKSSDELKINSITPNQEILRGFEPVTIESEIKTSGGINDGEATCYYRFSEDSDYIPFFETNSNSHKQSFNTITRGKYNLQIKCEDRAGNLAEEITSFEIIVDSKAPEVVRVYNDKKNLKLITNEEAECYYSFEKCNFEEKDAVSMSATFTKEHSTEFVSGKIYYIVCKDIWGNKKDGCSIQIRKW